MQISDRERSASADLNALQQLLDQVLGPPVTIGPDAQVNYRVVYIVVSHGILANTTTAEGMSFPPEARRRIERSARTAATTLERCPRTLLVAEGKVGPLDAWLLPRLLQLSTHQHALLRSAAYTVIASILKASFSYCPTWRLGFATWKALCILVKDVCNSATYPVLPLRVKSSWGLIEFHDTLAVIRFAFSLTGCLASVVANSSLSAPPSFSRLLNAPTTLRLVQYPCLATIEALVARRDESAEAMLSAFAAFCEVIAAAVQQGLGGLDLSMDILICVRRIQARPSAMMTECVMPAAAKLAETVAQFCAPVDSGQKHILAFFIKISEVYPESLTNDASLSSNGANSNEPTATQALVEQIRTYMVDAARDSSSLTVETSHEYSQYFMRGATSAAMVTHVVGIITETMASRSHILPLGALIGPFLQCIRRLLLKNALPASLMTSNAKTILSWCLESLANADRAGRLEAARLLGMVFNSVANSQLLQSNTLDGLRSLQDSTPFSSSKHEGIIFAWTCMARNCGLRELKLVLSQLMLYLGSGHPYCSALAFSEMHNVARARSQTPWQLLAPFWRDLAVLITQRAQQRPQLLRMVSEFLTMSESELLLRTQKFTIGYLVLSKRRQMLELIASASKISVYELILRNVSSVMAFLMMHPAIEQFSRIKPFLVHADSMFERVDVDQIIRSEPIPLLVEILQSCNSSGSASSTGLSSIGNGPYNRAERATACFEYVSLANVRTSNSSRPVQESSLGSNRARKICHQYLQENILGIFVEIDNLLNDRMGKRAVNEKIVILNGLELLVQICQLSMAPALPQMISCLQILAFNSALCTETLKVWLQLCRVLTKSNLISQMRTCSFAIVMSLWSRLDDSQRMIAIEICKALIDVCDERLADDLCTIPHQIFELAEIKPLLAHEEIQSILEYINAQPNSEKLSEIFRRAKNENSHVIHWGLIDMRAYFREHREELLDWSLREKPEEQISEALRILLDLVKQESTQNSETLDVAYDCIGILGAIDPNRESAQLFNEKPTIINDFLNVEENIRFVSFFIENFVVPAFLSTSNTKAQGLLGYIMQELCKYCGWTLEYKTDFTKVPDGPSRRFWVNMSEQVRETLTPFLSSRYQHGRQPPISDYSYPLITQQSLNFYQWLQTLLGDMLRAPKHASAQKLFDVFIYLIRIAEIPVLEFLLPFVVCHYIINNKDSSVITQEFLCVIQGSEDELRMTGRISGKFLQALELVFQTIDGLNVCLRTRRKVRISTQKRMGAGATTSEDDKAEDDVVIRKIESMLKKLPPDLLGHAAIHSGYSARALFYWEKYIRQMQASNASPSIMEGLYKELQHIYSQIDDPDGMKGIASKFHVLSIDQEILVHESSEQWEAAQSCYEICLESDPSNAELQVGLLRSFNQSGHYQTTLTMTNAILAQEFRQKSEAADLGLEAAWTTFSENDMTRFLSEAGHDSFNRAFCDFILKELQTSSKRAHLDECLLKLKRLAGSLCKQAGTDSTRLCYEHIAELHAIHEIDLIARSSSRSNFPESYLERRLDVTSALGQSRQLILAARRIAIELYHAADQELLADTWLQSASLARKSGQTQRSYHAILSALKLKSPFAIIEHARWWWEQKHQQKAISDLQGAIAGGVFDAPASSVNARTMEVESDFSIESSMTANIRLKDKNSSVVAGKAKLLLTKWLQVTGQLGHNELQSRFQDIVSTHPNWEKSHFHLGRFYNILYEEQLALPLEKRSEQFLTGNLLLQIVQCYLRSLSYGCKHVYETMPKIITLWLDFGASVAIPVRIGSSVLTNEVNQRREATLRLLNEKVSKRAMRLPPYLFFTAFSQILSRIAHPLTSVADILQKVICHVVQAYPSQALWPLMAVTKSNTKERQQRGVLVLNKLRTSSNQKQTISLGSEQYRVVDIISHAEKLTASLLQLCNLALGDQEPTFLLSSTGLKHLLRGPFPLVIPTQSNLTAALPAKQTDMRKHEPFSASVPIIHSFLDKVQVMSSLQRPRRVSVRATDGNTYSFLCKPKDDLRKDQRLMEFNTVVGKMLLKDRESARRELKIRTFAVVPLNEECGFIQWVNGTRPIRDILLRLYKQRGIPVRYGDVRNLLNEALSDPDPGKFFVDRILAMFPPVFHEWFAEMFPEPVAWLAGRLNYARTLAVMSMVGYVLGLGDRHGENILFDESTGDAVHVDFNCLFEKGLLFEKPERVPFRLTHNMVDALGPSGYEGAFRKSCEITMRLMRANQPSLKSVLESFLHDPLVEWNRKRGRSQHGGAPNTAPRDASLAELGTAEAKRVMGRINEKLNGYAGDEEHSQLSVDGQVQELITQAVDPNRLVQMYIGWSAFL